jgi:hypothetical protein
MPSILSTGFARLTCQSFEYLGYSEPYISYWPIVVPAARRPRRPQLEKVPTPIASPAEPVGSATVAPARRPLPRKTAVSTDTVWRRSLTRFGHGLCTEPEPYNLIPASRITAPNSLSDVVFPVSGRAGNREPILHHNDVNLTRRLSGRLQQAAASHPLCQGQVCRAVARHVAGAPEPSDQKWSVAEMALGATIRCGAPDFRDFPVLIPVLGERKKWSFDQVSNSQPEYFWGRR